MSRSPSLNLRLILAASVVLVAFLSLTGLALERAFARSSLALIEERLLAQVYGLLSAANVSEDGRLVVTGDMADPRFSVAESGLYGDVVGQAGEAMWTSPNTMGKNIAFPTPGSPGEAVFAATRNQAGEQMLAMTFPVEWEMGPEQLNTYVFRVAVPHEAYSERLRRFQRSLWGWLAAATAGLLIAQALVLAWCLSPLRKIAREVGEIEQGERTELSPDWPRELRPLAVNLNHLIEVSRRQIERYRNALGDLAHSFKTPLAVLRNLEARPEVDAGLRDTIRDQVERMDRTVDYQLQRAAASGRAALGTSVDLGRIAERLQATLQKVYASKGIQLTVLCPEPCHLRGDEGDLTEILGNLMDNACKWAREQVEIRLETGAANGLKAMVQVEVEDDGPGIAPEAAQRILARGVRLDENTPGHGIGLSIVKEIVSEGYAGELSIDKGKLGGALMRIKLYAPST